MLVYLGLNQKDMSDMFLEIHPSLLRSFQQEPHPAICEDFLHRDAPGCRYCMPLHLGQLHVFTPCVRALGGLPTALFHDESKSRQIWRWSRKPRKSIPFLRRGGKLGASSTLSSNSSHHWKCSLLQWPQDRWAEQNPLKTELSIKCHFIIINCIKQATAFVESWGQARHCLTPLKPLEITVRSEESHLNAPRLRGSPPWASSGPLDGGHLS